MKDVAVQLVDPEDNNQNQFPRTLAQLVLTSAGIDVETVLGNKKTKQTAVQNPTVDGTGVDFVDSVTQNENGDMTPHRKTVREVSATESGLMTPSDYMLLSDLEKRETLKLVTLSGTVQSSVDSYFQGNSSNLLPVKDVIFYGQGNTINPTTRDGSINYYDLQMALGPSSFLSYIKESPYSCHIIIQLGFVDYNPNNETHVFRLKWNLYSGGTPVYMNVINTRTDFTSSYSTDLSEQMYYKYFVINPSGYESQSQNQKYNAVVDFNIACRLQNPNQSLSQSNPYIVIIW